MPFEDWLRCAQWFGWTLGIAGISTEFASVSSKPCIISLVAITDMVELSTDVGKSIIGKVKKSSKSRCAYLSKDNEEWIVRCFCIQLLNNQRVKTNIKISAFHLTFNAILSLIVLCSLWLLCYRNRKLQFIEGYFNYEKADKIFIAGGFKRIVEVTTTANLIKRYPTWWTGNYIDLYIMFV